jgi:hypothetical protein
MNVTVSDGFGAAGTQAGNASPEASVGPDGDEGAAIVGSTLAAAVDGLAAPGSVEAGGDPGALSPGMPGGVEMQPDSAKTTDPSTAATDLRNGHPF